MATLLTLKGVASYAHLGKPEPIGPTGHKSGPPKYSVTLILDDDNDWAALNAELEAEKKAGFPNGWPSTGKWPLKQYTEQDAPNQQYVGKWRINYYSSTPVPVVDRNVIPIPKEQIDAEVYSGSHIIIYTAITAYRNQGQGVGCYMNGVQKIGDGPRLDNRPTVAQMFKPVDVAQNLPGYDPDAFPQGTEQNPGPQAGPSSAGPGPQGGNGTAGGMAPGKMPWE